MNQIYSNGEQDFKKLFFDVIIKGQIKTVFQPIVSLRDGQVYGYEALSRGPENSAMHSPNVLFEYAQKYNALWDLELLCRSKALEAVYKSQKEIKLFLNVNPNIMHDIKFVQGFTKEYLDRFSINAKNIVFEITEREAITNITDFKKAVENYKGQNYQIAIDDAGAGYSGLNMISDVRPHFLKLDMNLIRDIHQDTTKQALISSMYEFAKLSKTYLIAEGIETEQELAKLIEIGVHYGQGYFIGMPNEAILPVKQEMITLINNINTKKNYLLDYNLADANIHRICTKQATVTADTLISEVNDMICADSDLAGFCVTEDDRIIGVITRSYLYAKLSGHYGYSLNINKPVSNIMYKDFLSIDYQTPIEAVAKLAMEREPDKLYDFIAVTRHDRYLGVVTVKDLLEKAYEIKVVNAKHLNPLSELPGNILIEQYLEKCVVSKTPCCVLYFDIDNFKAYNDCYGFEKGDIAIKCLTRILKDHIPKDEFIGHIGGDDFIAVLCRHDAQILCDNIIEEFDESVKNFYSEEDIKKGFIVAKNRHGTEERFPLLSLSIAGITNDSIKNIYDLAEKASKLKKICKQRAGSIFILSVNQDFERVNRMRHGILLEKRAIL